MSLIMIAKEDETEPDDESEFLNTWRERTLEYDPDLMHIDQLFLMVSLGYQILIF